MRVMLQGYLQGANFGDILFAHMFYDKCKSLGFDVDFYQYKDYGIGDFCRKELGYTRHNSYLRNYKADALILISGGCLWDDRNRKGETRKRFYRYVLPARLYQMMGKPVYCLGVGGGPVDSRFLRYEIVKMLNNASVIQFRDEATCRVFEEYDVKNKINLENINDQFNNERKEYIINIEHVKKFIETSVKFIISDLTILGIIKK